MTRRLLGSSRYMVLLPVAGTFAASLTLEVYGILRALSIVVDVVRDAALDDASAKRLIVSSIGLIDIFLLGTVFLIIAVGLYELFIDDLPLPEWLRFRTLDDLKVRLAAVIAVVLLVAFLGYALEWRGGWEILAPGLSISAVILSTSVVLRVLAGEDHAGSDEPSPDPGAAAARAAGVT